MAPLSVAQDRLARGQNPYPHSTSGSSGARPQSNLSSAASTSKSPARNRLARPPSAVHGGGRGPSAPQETARLGAEKNEMWEESQQRHKAAVILGSWEMVTWYGIAGDESNPQTALRLKRMMIGLKDSPKSDQWEDERNTGGDGFGGSGPSRNGHNQGHSPQTKRYSKKKH